MITQTSSINVPLFADYKTFPKDVPAFCQIYVQKHNPDNLLHYHNCIEIGLCLEGSGTQLIGTQLYPFKENTVSVIQPDCIHDAHIPVKINEKGSVWKYLFVNPEDVGIPCDDFGGFLTDYDELVPLFHLMYNELEQKPLNYQAAFQALLSCFFIYAQRAAPSSEQVIPHRLPMELAKALQLIHSSYSEPLSVSGIAKQCNLSDSSLNRMFQAHFHISPLTYLHNVRLAAAEHLLQSTNLSVLTVATSVGYNSLSSFNRAFQKKYRMSPRAMRQNGNTCKQT